MPLPFKGLTAADEIGCDLITDTRQSGTGQSGTASAAGNNIFVNENENKNENHNIVLTRRWTSCKLSFVRRSLIFFID